LADYWYTNSRGGDDNRLLMALASDAIMIRLIQAPYKDFTNEDQFVEHLSVVKYSVPPPRE